MPRHRIKQESARDEEPRDLPTISTANIAPRTTSSARPQLIRLTGNKSHSQSERSHETRHRSCKP
jgi:hypothetical protein